MTYVVENGGPQRITRISTDGGFIAAEGTGWTYKYMITDYLGHVRSVVAARRDADGWFAEGEQRTDFYPYGLAHELGNLHVNRYLFGGKELQDHTIGKGSMLGFYDFHARYYNPVLGRWFNVDPKLQLLNPYLYCKNNPVMFIDPDGQWIFTSLFTTLFPGLGTVVGGLLDAVASGAIMGAASYTASVAMSPGGFSNWDWGQLGKSVGWGAASGAATFGVGKMFGSPGSFMLETARGLTHGAVQGGLSALQGGNFMSGFASGAFSSLAGSGYKAAGLTSKLGVGGMYGLGAISGGVGSAIAGGDFWRGAAIGVMNVGLNHLDYTVEFYHDEKEAFRSMQAYSKRTRIEIAGMNATNEQGESGIAVINHRENKYDESFIDTKVDDDGSLYVRDGMFRKYTLGEDHYHTHINWDQMQKVSQDDLTTQGKWSKPLNILYDYRIYILKQNAAGKYYYHRTKIKF